MSNRITFTHNNVGEFAMMAYKNNNLNMLKKIVQIILIHSNDLHNVPLWNQLLHYTIKDGNNYVSNWMVNLGANNISLSILLSY